MNNQLGTIVQNLQKSEASKTLMFNDKIVIIRPWKTRDERNFLIKKAALPKNLQENMDKVHELLINDLIKPCVIEGNIDQLSFNQLKLLMIELRMLSIGEEVDGITFKCQECGKHEEITVTFDEEFVKYTEGNYKEREISDSLKIRFKPMPHTIMKSKIDEIEILYAVVDEIIYNNVSYKDFTKQEFIEFFDALDLKTTKKIIKELGKSTDDLQIKTTHKCRNCGFETELDFGDVPNFYIP